MAVILQATAVRHRYAAGHADSLTGIDLQVCSGDALGIVGESGSGKSTLAKLLSGVMAPTGGEVLVKGRPWAGVRQRDQERRSVQMIFQDPLNALNPWMSALDTVAEAVQHWDRVSRAEALGRAELLLDEMGLTRGSMQRRPGGLSGGQCQRVGIARALACGPALLIADEPTSALDVSVQAQILNILVDLRAQHDLALVLISHDLAVVRYLTDSAIVMRHGVIVEKGTTDDLLTRPAHPYTQELLDSVVHTSWSRTTDRPR